MRFIWENINKWASDWASKDKGTWTTIWSLSKSALNPLQTNGCKQIARPSTKIGWNVCMFNLCREITRIENKKKKNKIKTLD